MSLSPQRLIAVTVSLATLAVAACAAPGSPQGGGAAAELAEPTAIEPAQPSAPSAPSDAPSSVLAAPPSTVFTSVLGVSTVPAAAPKRVAVVGDSLTLTATSELLLRFPLVGWDPVTVDGAAGQPVAARIHRVRELVDTGDLDAIVIALGSNDARLIVDSGQDVDAAWRVTQASAFTILADAQAVSCVIWVGVNSNTTRWHLDTWGAWFNNWVRYYAKFADWAAYSRGHQDWFLGDGVHLSVEGNAQYAELIVDTVAEQCG